MTDKITLGLSRNPMKTADLRAKRIDHEITERDFQEMTSDDRLVFIRIGMSSIEIPESIFRKLYAAVDTAFHAGMSYPEDAKRLHGLDRPICPFCSDGKITGLPGNACENCMNTGYADAGPDDLR